jgi:hypothetical protein
MHCTACGYDLRGLPEHACPECGRPFDPADPQTWGGHRAALYRRLARYAGWLCVLIALIPAMIGATLLAIGRQDLSIMIRLWVYACAPLTLVLCAWFVCLTGAGRLPRWRTLAFGLLLLGLNVSLFFEWPIYATFRLHRGALNTHAKQAQTLHTYNVPTHIGVFQIDRVSSIPRPGGKSAIAFKLKSDPSGPSYLVHGLAEQQIDSHFNVWSYRRLDRDWIIVHED